MNAVNLTALEATQRAYDLLRIHFHELSDAEERAVLAEFLREMGRSRHFTDDTKARFIRAAEMLQ